MRGDQKHRGIRVAGSGLLVACACGLGGGTVRAQTVPAATIPASDLTRLTVRVPDGTLEVVPGTADAVRVSVRMNGTACGRDGEVAQLRTQRDGHELRLEVQPSTKGRCDEHWRIELPVTLRLEARGDRVDMDIQGTRGGVDLRVGKGTIAVEAAAGDIEADVENGDVRVSTASGAYGQIRLASQVGRTELTLDGRTIRHPRPAGPGDWIEIGGPGEYSVSLRATVGRVRLDVGAMR